MPELPILKNSKVLVTGGAGFIGSNLIETFLSQNNQVVCLDNLSTGKKENIMPWLSHPGFQFIEGDIRNMNTCNQAVRGIDYVFHQAALGSVPRSVNDPATTHSVNADGFLNMLIASRDEKVQRFIYASSSSVYGDHPALPKREDAVGKPLSPYAITKSMNEMYASVFSKLFNMQITGLRYFNVFGKRQDPNGSYAAAIPKFIKSLIHKQSPEIFGDGNQTRDFTYVDNVIQINQLAALSKLPESLDNVYNVAFGQQTSLNELFCILSGLLSKYDPLIHDIKPVYVPERPGDVKHSIASIDKAKKLLGYEPEYSLAQGLEIVIDWYWNNFR